MFRLPRLPHSFPNCYHVPWRIERVVDMKELCKSATDSKSTTSAHNSTSSANTSRRNTISIACWMSVHGALFLGSDCMRSHYPASACALPQNDLDRSTLTPLLPWKGRSITRTWIVQKHGKSSSLCPWWQGVQGQSLWAIFEVARAGKTHRLVEMRRNHCVWWRPDAMF